MRRSDRIQKSGDTIGTVREVDIWTGWPTYEYPACNPAVLEIVS